MRSASDVRRALAAGVDALGFIVGVPHESDDAVSPSHARRLADLVPPYVTRVLVSHLPDLDRVDALADEIGADEVQTPASVPTRRVATARRRPRSTGVVYVEGVEAEARAVQVSPFHDAIHLDSQVAGRRGGTGATHDWSISGRIREQATRPVILSGGLTPANVARAVAAVRPCAVDVNSGVEDADGDKDLGLLLDFVAAARTPTS